MSPATVRERAFILAGGLGTRLRGLIPDRPKVLAPIAERPFLDILVEELYGRGIRRFVLLLGHRSEQVIAFVASRRAVWPADLEVAFSVEASPLGTGGALKLAAQFCDGRFLLLNGDTYFDLDLGALLRAHETAKASVTLAAASVEDAGRYGRLDVSAAGLVQRFREKDIGAGSGLINAGVYLMEPAVLEGIAANTAVSLENDVFPALLSGGQRVAVSPQTGAFFDIGTPASYQSFVAFCASRKPSLPTEAKSS
jgi:NDP-sugar pyrophosphorylase family protein